VRNPIVPAPGRRWSAPASRLPGRDGDAVADDCQQSVDLVVAGCGVPDSACRCEEIRDVEVTSDDPRILRPAEQAGCCGTHGVVPLPVQCRALPGGVIRDSQWQFTFRGDVGDEGTQPAEQ